MQLKKQFITKKDATDNSNSEVAVHKISIVLNTQSDYAWYLIENDFLPLITSPEPIRKVKGFPLSLEESNF